MNPLDVVRKIVELTVDPVQGRRCLTRAEPRAPIEMQRFPAQRTAPALFQEQLPSGVYSDNESAPIIPAVLTHGRPILTGYVATPFPSVMIAPTSGAPARADVATTQVMIARDARGATLTNTIPSETTADALCGKTSNRQFAKDSADEIIAWRAWIAIQRTSHLPPAHAGLTVGESVWSELSWNSVQSTGWCVRRRSTQRFRFAASFRQRPIFATSPPK